MSDLVVVIMAGGAGTRFWPASREKTPKQLLPLAGRPDEALLAATVRRLRPLVPATHVYVATGAHLVEATRRVLPEVPPEQILGEPVPRNTAPCVAWATGVIAERHGADAVVLVLPSDHFIADEAGFVEVLRRAVSTAERGYITMIGVVPSRPETGYGYIELGAELSAGVRDVARFVEKPERARAEEYVAGKRHLWNAGMFVFRAAVMLEAVLKHLPELANGVRAIGAAPERLAEIFPGLPSISIDHGVIEKADRRAVVPGDFGWSDVGSWESAWELAAKDASGNAAPEGTVVVDGGGNLVCDLTTGKQKKRFALVGVSDLVLVETDDAVLVIPRERAQDVRKVVEALKARGEKERL